MNQKNYAELMSALNYGFDTGKKLVLQWKNGFAIKCSSITGEYETDSDPNDSDYIGEYAAVVSITEIIKKGSDNSIPVFNNCIEISLKCIPEIVLLENASVLWEKV